MLACVVSRRVGHRAAYIGSKSLDAQGYVSFAINPVAVNSFPGPLSATLNVASKNTVLLDESLIIIRFPFGFHC